MLPSSRQLTPSGAFSNDEYPGEPGGASGGAGSGLPIARLLLALRRFWWIPALSLLLGVGAGLAYVRMIPPSYVSRAQMWEALKIRLPEGGLFSEDVQNFLGTQSELLRSPTVQRLALSRLQAGGTNVKIAFGKDGRPLPVDVQLKQAAKSAVYTLLATGPEPQYTRAYLDALMSAYLEYKRDVRKSASSDTLASIGEQVQRAERDLKDAQDSFASYQRTNNLAILQQEGTVAGGYLAQLRTRLADLELEAQLLAVAALGTNGSPADASGVAQGWFQVQGGNSPSITGAVPPEVLVALRDLEALRVQRTRLETLLRPKHPKMVKLTAEIGRLERQLKMFSQQNHEQLAAARRAVQMKTDNVKALIEEWQRNVIIANSRIAEAEQLRLQAQRAQAVYDRLMLLVQNVGISRNLDQDTLAVLEPASAARRSRERETSAMMLASVGGLGLGIALLALIGLRDDRFSSHVEVHRELGGLVVGQVPEVTGPKGQSSVPYLALDDDRYAFAEAYRSLRSALFYLTSDGLRPSTLLVTSAVPSEGKSTVALNLARTLAFGGSRVVLVDGDLRRGRLHDVLGGAKTPGLAELLRNPDGCPEAFQKSSVPGLTYVTRGGSLSNPSDLLLGPAFDRVLERCRAAFEYVVIDSSPVFACDDAGTIGPKMDGVLFVVRRDYSRTALVREALDVLAQRGAKVIGMVFNRANAGSKSYYHYRYEEYRRAGE